jgi:hypothetical protein
LSISHIFIRRADNNADVVNNGTVDFRTATNSIGTSHFIQEWEEGKYDKYPVDQTRRYVITDDDPLRMRVTSVASGTGLTVCTIDVIAFGLLLTDNQT